MCLQPLQDRLSSSSSTSSGFLYLRCSSVISGLDASQKQHKSECRSTVELIVNRAAYLQSHHQAERIFKYYCSHRHPLKFAAYLACVCDAVVDLVPSGAGLVIDSQRLGRRLNLCWDIASEYSMIPRPFD